MSFTSTNPRYSPGFTLIEMLVVAPLVILTVGGIIGLMITLIGDSVVSAERNNLTSKIHSSLDTMEKDISLSTDIASATGSLPSPQGSDNGTAGFTSNTSLILTQYATTTNPSEGARTLVYYNEPGAPSQYCGTPQQFLSPALRIQVVYFVRNATLYRRTIVPTRTTCGNIKPWQRNSCAVMGSAPCDAKDVELARGVTAMNIQYFTPGAVDTPASSAQTTTDSNTTTNSARVTLELSATAAGTTVKTSGFLRAAKLNN